MFLFYDHPASHHLGSGLSFLLKTIKCLLPLLRLYGFTKSSRQQKKKDIEAISYESVGGHGCSCLVTYGKYLGLAGFWKDERFLFAHHHTGNGFFIIFLLPGNNGELVLSRFLGGVDAAPQCANRMGKAACSFVLSVF